MATRKASKRGKRRSGGGRRSASRNCQPCTKARCEALVKRASTAQRARQRRQEQILLQRVARERPRTTVHRTTPTGFGARPVSMPFGGASRGASGQFRTVAAGGAPYWTSDRDARRRQRRGGRSRDGLVDMRSSRGARDFASGLPRRSSARSAGTRLGDFDLDMRGLPRRSSGGNFRGRGGRGSSGMMLAGGRDRGRSRSRQSFDWPDSRDWSGQPIRHARASVLGHGRRGNKPSRKFQGHRPPLYSSTKRYLARHPDARLGVYASPPNRTGRSRGRDWPDSRDWLGAPIRHARASVYGHARRGNKPSDKFLGVRPPLWTTAGEYRERGSRLGTYSKRPGVMTKWKRRAARRRAAGRDFGFDLDFASGLPRRSSVRSADTRLGGFDARSSRSGSRSSSSRSNGRDRGNGLPRRSSGGDFRGALRPAPRARALEARSAGTRLGGFDFDLDMRGLPRRSSTRSAGTRLGYDLDSRARRRRRSSRSRAGRGGRSFGRRRDYRDFGFDLDSRSRGLPRRSSARFAGTRLGGLDARF